MNSGCLFAITLRDITKNNTIWWRGKDVETHNTRNIILCMYIIHIPISS